MKLIAKGSHTSQMDYAVETLLEYLDPFLRAYSVDLSRKVNASYKAGNHFPLSGWLPSGYIVSFENTLSLTNGDYVLTYFFEKRPKPGNVRTVSIEYKTAYPNGFQKLREILAKRNITLEVEAGSPLPILKANEIKDVKRVTVTNGVGYNQADLRYILHAVLEYTAFDSIYNLDSFINLVFAYNEAATFPNESDFDHFRDEDGTIIMTKINHFYMRFEPARDEKGQIYNPFGEFYICFGKKTSVLANCLKKHYDAHVKLQ